MKNIKNRFHSITRKHYFSSRLLFIANQLPSQFQLKFYFTHMHGRDHMQWKKNNTKNLFEFACLLRVFFRVNTFTAINQTKVYRVRIVLTCMWSLYFADTHRMCKGNIAINCLTFGKLSCDIKINIISSPDAAFHSTIFTQFINFFLHLMRLSSRYQFWNESHSIKKNLIAMSCRMCSVSWKVNSGEERWKFEISFASLLVWNVLNVKLRFKCTRTPRGSCESFKSVIYWKVTKFSSKAWTWVQTILIIRINTNHFIWWCIYAHIKLLINTRWVKNCNHSWKGNSTTTMNNFVCISSLLLHVSKHVRINSIELFWFHFP